MQGAHGQVKIFSGNSNRPLAQKIADQLGLPLGKMEVSRFSDGEVNVNILETVRGCDVFLVQSTSNPVNENLMELLVMIDAVKRAAPARITAVIPYFGYARQDRKARSREPISAKLVANLLEKAGADQILTMDLHSSQVQGFFDIPVDNLMGMPILAQYFAEQGLAKKDLVVVAPDIGGVARSRKLADKFNVNLAIIDKRRPKANVSEVMNVIGEVAGKTCLMLDDIIDTAGTITHGATALVKDKGAKAVYVCCSHAVLSGAARERLQQSPIKEVVILDTIALPAEKQFANLKVITVANLFAAAIERLFKDLPVSCLYE